MELEVVKRNYIVMFSSDVGEGACGIWINLIHCNNKIAFFADEEKSGLMATVIVALAYTNVLFE